MQLLYAADFDVVGTSPDHAEAALLRHLATWLTYRAAHGVEPDDLLRDGAAEMAPGQDGESRFADWTVAGRPGDRATRAEVRQRTPGGATFVTRVTVGLLGGRASLRVSMARETGTVWLSPVASSELHQPALVRNVALDESLELRVSGQVVTARYLKISNQAEAEAMATALLVSTRLPVVLLHARAPRDWATARALSTGLIGLASVATVNRLAAEVISEAMPGAAVPYGGARLVWSDPRARHPSYPSALLAELEEGEFRNRLFQRLGELSVFGRGTDAAYRTARAVDQTRAREAAEERIAAAARAKNFEAQAAELRDELARERNDRKFWEDEAASLEEQVSRLTANAADADRYQRDAEYWREQYELARASANPPQDPWEAVPGLDPYDGASTFRALEVASSGRVVFTPNAERSWSKSPFPYPEEMTAQLVTLARAACRLYEQPPESMPHLDRWFKTEFGLNVAMSDDTISKNKSLRYFDFEDQRRDQTPHVKVRDAVKPNEVGRVHFALDPAEGRFIINHVGVKLYGL